MPEPDPELFREVFGRFATGVAVITSATPPAAGGMTANALCSLSLEPLLALVCFENNARTLPIVREAGRFAVNVLSCRSGGRGAGVRLEAARVREARGRRAPLRRRRADHRGALSWVVCSLRELIAGGDHTIAIGEVVALGLGEGEPLLWYAGRYHDFGRPCRALNARFRRSSPPAPAAQR